MNKKNIESRLKDAYKAVTPDVFDEILLKTENEKGCVNVNKDNRKPRKARVLKIALAAAAALLLLIGAVIGGIALHEAIKKPSGTELPVIGESAVSPSGNTTETAPAPDGTPDDTTEITVVNPPILENYNVSVVRAPVNAAAPDGAYFLGVYMSIDVNVKKVTVSATVTRGANGRPQKRLNSKNYGDEGYEQAVKDLLIAAAEEGYFSDERNLITVSVDPSEFEKVSKALNAAYAELIERGLLTTDSSLTGKVDPQQMLYLA